MQWPGFFSGQRVDDLQGVGDPDFQKSARDGDEYRRAAFSAPMKRCKRANSHPPPPPLPLPVLVAPASPSLPVHASPMICVRLSWLRSGPEASAVAGPADGAHGSGVGNLGPGGDSLRYRAAVQADMEAQERAVVQRSTVTTIFRHTGPWQDAARGAPIQLHQASPVHSVHAGGRFSVRT